MSDTTSRKQWWLILRREGYRTITMRVPIKWVKDGSELDPIVDPLPDTDDWEFVNESAAEDLVLDDPDHQVRYELVATTQLFESLFVDVEAE